MQQRGLAGTRPRPTAGGFAPSRKSRKSQKFPETRVQENPGKSRKSRKIKFHNKCNNVGHPIFAPGLCPAGSRRWKKTRAKPKNPPCDPPSKKKTCQKSQYKTDVLESGHTDRNQPNVRVAYTSTEILENPMPDTATDKIQQVIPIMHIPCYAHAHGHTRPTHLRFAVGGSPCTARDRPVCDMQREVLFA